MVVIKKEQIGSRFTEVLEKSNDKIFVYQAYKYINKERILKL